MTAHARSRKKTEKAIALALVCVLAASFMKRGILAQDRSQAGVGAKIKTIMMQDRLIVMATLAKSDLRIHLQACRLRGLESNFLAHSHAVQIVI